MPELKGSCHCGAVSFTVESHGRHPYMRCYCSICRKQAGAGGYAINLGGVAETMKVDGMEHVTVYRAPTDRGTSSGRRHFCKHCGSALWLFDPTWPELVHPFAGAIDSDLPVPPEIVHIMLDSKANWVEVPEADKRNVRFESYPELSIEDWHKSHGLWEE